MFFLACFKLDIQLPVTLKLDNGVEVDADTYDVFDYKGGYTLIVHPQITHM